MLPAARARLGSIEKGAIVCISAVIEAELLYGIAESDAGGQRKRLLGWFLARLDVEPWGREEAAVYGQLRARQERIGKNLGPFDMQIAGRGNEEGADIRYLNGSLKNSKEVPTPPRLAPILGRITTH